MWGRDKNMTIYNKISELTEQELIELDMNKTDWWFIAKEVIDYIDKHPSTRGFVVWLNKDYLTASQPATALKKQLRKLDFKGLELMKISSTKSEHGRTKLFVRPRG